MVKGYVFGCCIDQEIRCSCSFFGSVNIIDLGLLLSLLILLVFSVLSCLIMLLISICGVDVLVVRLMCCLLIIYVGLIFLVLLIRQDFMFLCWVSLLSWLELELLGEFIISIRLQCLVRLWMVFWWFWVVQQMLLFFGFCIVGKWVCSVLMMLWVLFIDRVVWVVQVKFFG